MYGSFIDLGLVIPPIKKNQQSRKGQWDVLIGESRIYVYIRSRNQYSYRKYNDSGYRDSAKCSIYRFIKWRGKHL